MPGQEGQTGFRLAESLRQAQTLFSGPSGAPTNELVDIWKRLSGGSSSFWQALAGRGTSTAPVFDPRLPLASGLDTATLGFSREYLEDLRAIARAGLEYQRRVDAMATLLGKIHQSSLELLIQRLEERQREGQSVNTFRGIYDLWIECGEQTFRQTAHGDEYARLQAELTNAFATLRVRQQALSERTLASLNLPNRAEMDTAHRRVKELRHRIDELERTIADLRDRVAAGQEARRSRPEPKARKRVRSSRPAGREA